jgi:hypothetical protein
MTNVPTSRELIALTKCVYRAFTPFCVYVFAGNEVRVNQRGVYLPEPYHSFDIESLWCEFPDGTMVCLRGDARGRWIEGRPLCRASA